MFATARLTISVPLGIICVCASMSLLVISRPAMGFKPNEHGHLGITTEALLKIAVEVEGRVFKFSDRAIAEVRAANRATDMSPTFFGVAEHFDDEDFEGASKRLVDLKFLVVALI